MPLHSVRVLAWHGLLRYLPYLVRTSRLWSEKDTTQTAKIVEMIDHHPASMFMIEEPLVSLSSKQIESTSRWSYQSGIVEHPRRHNSQWSQLWASGWSPFSLHFPSCLWTRKTVSAQLPCTTRKHCPNKYTDQKMIQGCDLTTRVRQWFNDPHPWIQKLAVRCTMPQSTPTVPWIGWPQDFQ